MGKVFLSHSSKDKAFVRKVAEIIGLNFCIIDECEFEIGMKNIDEIFKGISRSDIFVYFISNNSLESVWVKRELNIAAEKLNNFSERKIQIYPIIIDKDVKYSDDRIADYLRTGECSYNIRHVLKPEIAARKIRTQLVKLEMAQDRRYEEQKNYFYGRDEEKVKLKNKVDDVMNEKGVRCIIVSGVPGIGRKSFITAALKDIGIMEKYYFPITISMGRDDSIDNLLRSLNNVGIGEYSLDLLSQLNSMEDKIDVLVEMLIEIQNYQEFLVIDDNACIVRMNGGMVYWFEKAIAKIKSKLSVAVVSEIQLDEFKYRRSSEFAYISLKELSKSDTLGMLRTYSKLENIPFEKEDRDFVSDCLSGYPPQIQYCVLLAQKEGIDYVKNHTYEVKNMPAQVSSKLIDMAYDNFQEKDTINCLLALISQFGTIPVTLINKILNLDEKYKDAFYRLRALSICYYVGNEKEYIKLNSFLQSFVERNKFEVLSEVQALIKNNVIAFESKIEDEQYTDELDYLEVNYYVKELLKNEKKVPDRFLYGTVFLQSLISLYNERQYNKVIKIVEGLLQENQMISYEKEIEGRIMYYYCLALARKKSPEFESKVQYFQDEDTYITYNFLKGFHYRILGNFTKAENSYQNVLKKSPQDMKTRRELVFIYVSNQQYELALDLARINYKQNKNNIHSMQAYFDCLIYKKHLTHAEEEDIAEIIDTVKTIYKSIKLNSMYYQILAKNEAFKNESMERAIEYIDEGIQKNNDGIISYLLKEKFDIYEFFGDIKGMEVAIDQLSDELEKLEIDDARMNNIVSGRQALLSAYKRKPRASIQMELYQNTILSSNAKDKIMTNVDKILAGQKIFY